MNSQQFAAGLPREKMKLSTAGFFLLLGGCLFGLVLAAQDVDIYRLSTMQIIEKFGYPRESHLIETEDGYIIQMHRIPHGKNNKTIGKPFLMQHGMFSTSHQFLLLGENSLAFLAADRGYDIWLGNIRGNRYGSLHRTLASHTYDFWDFSWHENGIYDLTAQIDYICNHTRHDKVLFLGYSMGTTAYFAMAAVRQEYQKKVEGAIMVTPLETFRHTREFSRTLSPFVKIFSEHYRKAELCGFSPLRQELVNYWCFLSPVHTRVCKDVLFLAVGGNPDGLSEEVLHNIIGQTPSGTSLKTLLHYMQVAMTGKLQQFDYGRCENLKRYGRPEPPEYDLESINTPLSLLFTPSDNFVSPEDADYLLRRLPNVKSVEVIDRVEFNHLDFGVHNLSKEIAYTKVLKHLDELAGRTTQPVEV